MRKIVEAQVDMAELTVRIAEKAMGVKRPKGMDGKTALAALTRQNPAIMRGFQAAAEAAMLYMVECVNESGAAASVQ